MKFPAPPKNRVFTAFPKADGGLKIIISPPELNNSSPRFIFLSRMKPAYRDTVALYLGIGREPVIMSQIAPERKSEIRSGTKHGITGKTPSTIYGKFPVHHGKIRVSVHHGKLFLPVLCVKFL